MIVNTDNNKPTFEAENWKEKFTIKISQLLINRMKEGAPLPRWFLPVREEINRYDIECWIFPLAPFVWSFYLLRDILWVIWRDMFRWGQLVRKWRELKK